MALPWVAREAYEAVQDALGRERTLHQHTRNELTRLTEILGKIAEQSTKPAPEPRLPDQTKLPEVVVEEIARIAEGDNGLRAVLRRKAFAWRKARPDLDDVALAEAIRTNEMPERAA